MTNEQYLYVSYFAAAVGGASLATLTAMVLAGPLRKVTKAEILPQLGKLLRRAFPSWLILTALLGLQRSAYCVYRIAYYAQRITHYARRNKLPTN